MPSSRGRARTASAACRSTELGPAYEAAIATHPPAEQADLHEDDPALYTSGTTGVPKGVLTTHRNLARPPSLAALGASTRETISLTPLPMFHIGGIGWAFLGLWNGATTILVSEFDAGRVLDLLERERVTNAVFVPTMLQMLAAVPGAAERDYSRAALDRLRRLADHHAGAQGGAAHVPLRRSSASTA